MLAGCANPFSVAALNAARGNFEAQTRPAQMMVQYDLANSAGLTAGQRERQEREAVQKFSPACMKPYTEKLYANVASAIAQAQATYSLSAIDRLPEDARRLDSEFDKCVGAFGVIGYNFVVREDGREQRIPAYLAELVASLRRYGDAHAQVEGEKQVSAAIAASGLAVALVAGAAASGNGVNPDQIYIEPYVRHDGTMVRGHWRTMPNDTCLDNIRGCRSGKD
jgi:hypothetical protein